jgi:hypothetical protein
MVTTQHLSESFVLPTKQVLTIFWSSLVTRWKQCQEKVWEKKLFW